MPLTKRREIEMQELRDHAREGNKRAAAEVKRRCRAGMLIPAWER
jgi:hypothetical protein